MSGRAGFTLLEIMLAVSILAAVTVVAWMCFGVVTTAWKKSVKLGEQLHHGDYVLEQIVMGLRSAYFPEGGAAGGIYGFRNEDNGEGAGARDLISWVKLGGAMVGNDCPFAGSPHRVRLTVRDRDDGTSGLALQAWRVQGQAEDFDPDAVEPVDLPGGVQGLNCRMAYRRKDGEIEWLDDWEETNRLPTLVEMTLTLEPLADGEAPVELHRLVSIPVGALSWR